MITASRLAEAGAGRIVDHGFDERLLAALDEILEIAQGSSVMRDLS
jgi:hypothetical protein